LNIRVIQRCLWDSDFFCAHNYVDVTFSSLFRRVIATPITTIESSRIYFPINPPTPKGKMSFTSKNYPILIFSQLQHKQIRTLPMSVF